MSIFPTEILLATDGSEEASLAARTAVDLAYKTGSELHVVNVGLHDFGYPIYAVPEVEQARTIQKEVTQEARKLLDAEVVAGQSCRRQRSGGSPRYGRARC